MCASSRRHRAGLQQAPKQQCPVVGCGPSGLQIPAVATQPSVLWWLVPRALVCTSGWPAGRRRAVRIGWRGDEGGPLGLGLALGWGNVSEDGLHLAGAEEGPDHHGRCLGLRLGSREGAPCTHRKQAGS